MSGGVQRKDDAMTTRETAEFLGFSEYTVRDLAKKGEIPGWKRKHEWRFSRSQLLDHIRGGDRETGGASPESE